MLDSLTPALVLIDILIFSVIFPLVVIFQDGQKPVPPVSLRRKAIALMALVSGFPLASVVFWDHLGLPSDPHSWTAFFLFWLAQTTLLILLVVLRYVERGSLPKAALAGVGFGLFVVIQLAAPLAATLIDIYSKKVSSNISPLTADACGDPNIDPIFAHISDLHITERSSTRDGKRPGNVRLASVLQRVNDRKPPFLIVSGDITDEGMSEQWKLVDRLFQPLRSNTRILVSTGNHDLNYFFGRDPEEHPWTWFGLKPLAGLDAEPRIFRAAEFQARHIPEVQGSAGGTVHNITSNVPNKSNLAHFPRQIEECAVSCVWNSGNDPAEVKLAIAGCRASCASDLESIRFHYFRDLSDSFPLYYVDEVSHTAFISLTTSMAETKAVGRNAIGLSGKDQIKNLKAELAGLPASVKYIVLVQHHPLLWNGVPPFPHFHWSDLLHPGKTFDIFYTSPWFLAVFLHNNVAEGEQTYAMLKDELARRPGTSALVAFGHRHQRSLSRIGPIIFEEAPNLATEDDANYGFYLVGQKANELRVSWCKIDAN